MSLTLDMAGCDRDSRWMARLCVPRRSWTVRPTRRAAPGWPWATRPWNWASCFACTGTRGDERLTVEGDLNHVHGLGREMSRGHLLIRGNAGPQLGAEMTGGAIEVDGSAGDWAGAEMRGGLITIRGNTGSFLGAAYPGSRLGMRDGVILVEGSAGDDAGLQMRRGLIAIRGSAGGGLGRSHDRGHGDRPGSGGQAHRSGDETGDAGVAITARASRGALAAHLCPSRPVSLAVPDALLPAARGVGFLGASRRYSLACLDRYNGDMVVGGRGEILAGQHSRVRLKTRAGGRYDDNVREPSRPLAGRGDPGSRARA